MHKDYISDEVQAPVEKRKPVRRDRNESGQVDRFDGLFRMKKKDPGFPFSAEKENRDAEFRFKASLEWL